MGSLVVCECPADEDFPVSLMPEVSMLDEIESEDNLTAFIHAVDACDGPGTGAIVGNLRERGNMRGRMLLPLFQPRN